MTRTDRIEAKTVSQALRIVSVLAEGHSNIVALLQNQESLQYTVAKVLNDESQHLAANLKAEADILSGLDHPRILKAEGFSENLTIVDEDGTSMLATGMLMEHAPRGDLFDVLSHFGQLPSLIARFYAKQMVDAVAYLHGKGMAHLDVKLENILLDSKFEIKLADFGFSRVFYEDQLINERVGTPDYWSPDQIEQTFFNGLQSDVFSLGMAIFMLVAGRMPFESASKDDEYYVHFYNANEEEFWQMHEEEMNPSSSMSFFKDEFKSLINGMLKYKASERMTINEVMNHPWLKIAPEISEKCGGIVAEYLKKKGIIN
jgi:serine/threonine protein kinase